MPRNPSYRAKWTQLVQMHGSLCYYCREQIATTIDHIVPYAWDEDNEIENLVPACALCNSLAGSMLFEDVTHKRQYILAKRKSSKVKRCICTVCLLPYGYKVMSPGLFLCAECYDAEYGTRYARRSIWLQWLTELEAADILPEAHRYALKRAGPACNKRAKRQFLYHLITYYEDHPMYG